MIVDENETNDTHNSLDPKLLELLSKPELSPEDKMRIYELTVNFFCNNYTDIISNVVVEYINDPHRPISQKGFSIDYDHNNKFNHIIFANVFFLNAYPIERIILIACHESAHLEKNDRIANSLDFLKKKTLKNI